MGKNIGKILSLCLLMTLVTPLQTLQAASDILINDEDANQIGSYAGVAKTQSNQMYAPSSSNLDYSYLVPDYNLRTYINRTLKKTGDEIETYNPTVEDLESITSFDLYASRWNNSNDIMTIESFEGMQYMTNVTYMRLMHLYIPESALEYVGQMSSLDRLVVNMVMFSGNDGTVNRLNAVVDGETEQEQVVFAIDQYVDLSPLANLSLLTDLSFTLNGMDQTAAYSYANRTHYDVSELGRLTALTNLSLQGMASVDDPSFGFIENLPNLLDVSLILTPLNDVEPITTLPNLQKLNISNTYVTDFTPIIDQPYFSGATGMYINSPTLFYDSIDDGQDTVDVVALDTGIKLGAEPTEIGYTTLTSHLGAFNIYDYQYDDQIKLTFNINELKDYNLRNWITGQFDSRKLGFVWGANITAANGKKINYSVNTVTIGKKITFDYNYENGPKVVEYYEPFAAVEQITPERVGYDFIGWYQDQALTDPLYADQEISANTTVYAKWEATSEPVDPVDPVDPIDPVDPVEPELPDETEPVDPVDPVEPELPDETEPVDPVDPVEPELPDETEPVEPIQMELMDTGKLPSMTLFFGLIVLVLIIIRIRVRKA